MMPLLSSVFRWICLVLVLQIAAPVHAQTSKELKAFLWKNNFRDMIQKYGQETLTLQDSGLAAQRLNARRYVEVPGFRVQLFAGSSRERAEQVAGRLQHLNLDSVYVVVDNGLYKVQLGNFSERLEAAKMLDRLRFRGETNAWIVQATIHKPKQPVSADSVRAETAGGEERLAFAIQLFVTGDAHKAQRLQSAFSRKFSLNIRLIKQGDFWKVLAGSFPREEDARRRLKEIQAAGFPDAWITQVSPSH